MIDQPPAIQERADELALVRARMESPAWNRIEEIEAGLAKVPQVEMPLRHLFVPHMYCREIMMPKGTLLTSRIHLTEHFFVVSAGAVAVWDDDHGKVILSAPHTGITKPGTRRVLFAIEDTIWSTFHVTDKTDPDEIVREVTFSEGKFQQLGVAAAKRSLTEGQT